MRARGLVGSAALGLALAGCGTPRARETRPAAVLAPDRCDDLATCEASCKHDRTDACVEAATWMGRRPLDVDLARLVAVLGRACDGGHGLSCFVLADVLSTAPSLPRDESREHRLRARACELGEPGPCLDLAEVRDPHGKRVAAPDAAAGVAHALALAEAGCAAGKGRHCVIAGAIYLGFVPPDPAKQAAFERKASDALEASCFRGVADDCTSAVVMEGPAAQADPERIQRILNRGCELGNGEACFELAKRTTTATAAERAAWLKRACDDGREDGCFALAEMQRAAASGAARNFAGSVTMDIGLRLARAHCDLGDARGCATLAGALARGVVPAAEAARTVDDLERVCEHGELLTCSGVADALLQGPAALRDEVRGARLKKRACELGYPFACPDPLARMRATP
jgi:TPR repeat protein